MRTYFLKFGIGALSIAFPTVALAQTNTTLLSLSQSAVGYFNMAIEVILGLAVVVFIFNIYRYFFLDRENNKERGMYLLWSIIGFAVILCFWGLVNLVTNTFNLDNSAPTSFGNMFGGSSNTLTGNNSNPFGSSVSGTNSSGSTISNPFGSSVSGNQSQNGSGSTATCGGTSAPPAANGITYTCQNGYWNEISSASATCGGTSYPPDGNTYVCNNGYWDETSSASAGTSDVQNCMNSGGTLAICEETFPNDNSSYVQCMDSGSTDAICAGMTSGNNSSTGSTATCGGTSYPPDGNTYTCQNGYWDEVSSASQNSSDNTGSYTQDNTDTSQPSDSGGSSCTEQYDADGNDLGCF